jgi:hypothetical protein
MALQFRLLPFLFIRTEIDLNGWVALSMRALPHILARRDASSLRNSRTFSHKSIVYRHQVPFRSIDLIQFNDLEFFQ